MAKYTIDSDYCSVFGMDTHARSTTVKGRDLSTGRTRTKRFGDCPSAESIMEWMTAHFTPPFYAAYESGCTGFHLARELRAVGVACDVVAATSIARSDEDRKQKNDRRDAARVLSELLNPESSISLVWVPDPECEAARDLVRCRLDATSAMKRSKQHVSSTLMRHGWVWNERTAAGNLRATWSRDYIKWAKSADFGEAASNEALRRYILIAEEDIGRVSDLNSELAKMAALPRWKPYVDAISLIKGVDWFGALLVAAEIGDFDRFGGGRDVSKWIGTIPRENSSGGKVSRGRITKAGNDHVRTVLLEGVAGAGLRRPGAKRARDGQVVSPEVKATCAKASKRLKARFDHLVGRGLPVNKAKIAVVNELIRWIWVVGKMVQAEQRALAARS